jgi:uncharacterized protein (DUF2164 family)
VKPIKFEKEERAAIVGRIQLYFREELDSSIGEIPAELLLNFFSETVGAFYYNQGLADAKVALGKVVDEVEERIYALERREARVR